MMRYNTMCVGVMLSCLLACGSNEEPSEETPEEPETVEVDPAEPDPPPNPPQQPPNRAEAMAAFSAALEAAANAEGDTPCEQTYNGFVAMFAAMPAGPNGEPMGDGLPERGLFISECQNLPEDAQRCMNPGYGMQHPECAEMLSTPEAEAFRTRLGAPPTPRGPAQGRPGMPPPRPGGLPPGMAQLPPSEGDTPCEQAYNGMQRMFDNMRDAPAGAQMPDRARFITACGELPEENQRCVDPAYGAGHPECIQWMATPAALAFREAILGGPR